MKQKVAAAASSASAAKRAARVPGKPRKREMKKIENKNSLMVTFSKRRKGLFKKAGDLCTLCDAQVAVITFSPHGKPYTFAHPSVDEVIDRYQGKDRGGRNQSFPQETTNRGSDSTMQPLAKEKESMKLDLVAELKKELKDELKRELREELKGDLQEGMMKELEHETGAARARIVELEKEEWMALRQSQKEEEDKEKEKEKEKKKEEEEEEEGLFFIKHKPIEEMSPEELETFKAFLEGNRERVNLRLDEHKNRKANTIDFLGLNG